MVLSAHCVAGFYILLSLRAPLGRSFTRLASASATSVPLTLSSAPSNPARKKATDFCRRHGPPEGFIRAFEYDSITAVVAQPACSTHAPYNEHGNERAQGGSSGIIAADASMNAGMEELQPLTATTVLPEVALADFTKYLRLVRPTHSAHCAPGVLRKLMRLSFCWLCDLVGRYSIDHLALKLELA
jgi:hypothetical protein